MDGAAAWGGTDGAAAWGGTDGAAGGGTDGAAAWGGTDGAAGCGMAGAAGGGAGVREPPVWKSYRQTPQNRSPEERGVPQSGQMSPAAWGEGLEGAGAGGAEDADAGGAEGAGAGGAEGAPMRAPHSEQKSASVEGWPLGQG
jgi:hypothetical protein